jgi:hypothetical protein
MIKPLIILFNTFFVFLCSFIIGDDSVTLTGNFPKAVKPKTEFTAEILIKKPNISGFAKLQIDVPKGFIVKEIETNRGSFSFSNNIAKIIWVQIPSEPEFTVKFLFTADRADEGLKTITAKFSYLENNNKALVQMNPIEINVSNNADALVSQEEVKLKEMSTDSSNAKAPLNIDSIANNNEVYFENLTEPNSSIICNRTIKKGKNKNEYDISVKINKGSIKGFAKFQELLPLGCTIKSKETNGGSFSESDGKAKFVWVSLPPDEEINISYILETNDLTPADAKLEKGEFSYLENEQSKKSFLKVDLIAKSGVIENLTSDKSEIKQILVETKAKKINTKKEKESLSVSKDAIKRNKKEKVAKAEKTKPDFFSQKQGNVIYSLQIGAFKKSVSTEKLIGRFNLKDKVRTEMSNGYHKFMVGNFSEYKTARIQREAIKQNGCESAFVVAYNGTNRITVQEALMILSQKWFK